MEIKEKILFWDWNGTILNDAHICLETMNGMLRKRDMPELDMELYKEVFGFPVVEYYQKVGFDFSREGFEELSMEFITAYNRTLGDVPLTANARQVLANFRRQGRQQLIVSAMRRDMLLESVAEKQLDHFFIEILGVGDIYAASKSQMAKAFVKQKGMNVEEILFIGDTLHDFEVAEEIGCHCLLVADGHQSKERLLATGALVVDSLSDLLS